MVRQPLQLVLVGLLIVVGLPLAGCFTTSARMHSLAEAIERDAPSLELDHQFGLTMGRMSLGLAKGVAKWAVLDEDEPEALAFFKGVKKVELATFEATSGHDAVQFPERLQASLKRQGWHTLARFRDGDELAWIVYREQQGALRNIMVMALEERELTLIRLGGRLDKILKAALAYVDDEIGDRESRVASAAPPEQPTTGIALVAHR